MAPHKEGLDMMRKSKKTDLAAEAVQDAAEPVLASRNSGDRFQGMDRWFDDLRNAFERKFWGPLAPFGGEDGLAVRRPLVDLADKGNEYILTAELPGVRKEDLDLRVTPDGLELAAETSREEEENGKDYAYRERAYESFRRGLSFPEEIVAEKVEAKLKDGVLEVRLPKKEPTPAHEPVRVRVQ